jgi:hypothetical protein
MHFNGYFWHGHLDKLRESLFGVDHIVDQQRELASQLLTAFDLIFRMKLKLDHIGGVFSVQGFHFHLILL